MVLAHYPVISKKGEVIASAVTNLDLHDIARAARTYGARSLYIVTPLQDQLVLVDKIVSHWVSGTGAAYNPQRREALSIIRTKKTFAGVLDEIEAEGLGSPRTIATSAKRRSNPLAVEELRELIQSKRPCALVFGTAWGLTEDFIEQADYVLAPLEGVTDYNHLSVRSAAAIILDRLLGN